MEQILDVRTVRLTTPTYLTLGNFDGMHRGHAALLTALRQAAAGHPAPATTALLTFDPHPLIVLRPQSEHHLLTTPAERVNLAAGAGVDYGIIQPFTHELAALSAREFLTLLKTHLNLAGLVVGPDFALGRNREGTIERLRELGQTLGYTVHVMDPVTWQGQAARSSVIREHLRTGDVAAAWELLGRPYHATGTVVEGDRRGRLLGTPTANVEPPADKLWPAHGVYATRTWIWANAQPVAFWSVTNLGVRPTVDGQQRRFETHLLDFPPKPASGETALRPTDLHAYPHFSSQTTEAGDVDGLPSGIAADGDLYGQEIAVEFVARLRGEMRFNGLEELQTQIQRDIAAARTLFSTLILPVTGPLGLNSFHASQTPNLIEPAPGL